MSNQEPSSSSSIKNSKQNMEEIKKGQEEKKLKEDAEHEIENEMEVIEMQSFVEELPPEMLMKILEHLDTKSLVVSRLVSRKWNEILYKIIQSRDDVEIKFFCRETEAGNIKIRGRTKRASLENFIKCFEDSKEAPLYTRFRFQDFKAPTFDHPDWLKFISYFGESARFLKLKAADYKSVDDAMPWAEKLRKLLLYQLPNLQEFGLQFPHDPSYNTTNPGSKLVQLFPTLVTATSSNVETTVQIPHLKVLYLDDMGFSNFTGIVTDLLNASVNLQKIEFAQKDNCDGCFESLYLLESLGKLHSLQTASINLDTGLLPKLQENPSFPLSFKLKKLSLSVNGSVYKDRNFWPYALVFISHLFESSKDTLKELEMEPVGFLPYLKLPKFSKLRKMSIQRRAVEGFQFLPSGLELNEIFPLLQHLNLRISWPDVFPHDENQGQNVWCLPNLKTLEIMGYRMTKEDVARIPVVCPNLKELKIYHLSCGGASVVDNVPKVATAIWTHLTKLESLYLMMQITSPAVDSSFTGFSGEFCTRLYDLIQGEEFFKKSGWGYQIELSKSEFAAELEAERKNPSILDLKDLKNLTVDLWIRKDDPGFCTKILKVSEKYAFQLMENLNYKINKNVERL